MQKSDIILKSSAIFSGKEESPFCGMVAVKDNEIQYVGNVSELENYKGYI